jgi:hypothetical protein
VNKRTTNGWTPLYLALGVMPHDSEKDKTKIATLLREAGAQEPTALELQQLEQEIAQMNAMMEENAESEED